jgi:hypothetical protein
VSAVASGERRGLIIHFQNPDSVINDHGNLAPVLSKIGGVGGRSDSGIGVMMMRYVAFLVPGIAFVTGIMATVQTHRVAAEPKVLFTSTPVNYVDDHWPSSVLTTPMRSVSR